jgi:glycosyltransferase involved in cell wall biosynthesis
VTEAPALTVLHIDTERGWRGGERQVYWLAVAMQARGHRPLVAARPGEPLAERLTNAGIEIVPVAPAVEFDPRAVARLRRVIRREGVAIVHAHTGHAVALAALATAGGTARMVLTRRVDFPLRRNLGTRWKYSRAHGFIAISRAIAGIMAKGGIDPSRIAIVPSGVDLSRQVRPATAEEIRALGLPSGAPWAVQVGALVQHKDPVNFVRAVAAARRTASTLHGVLVGDGPLRGRVQSAIREAQLDGVVHLAGHRSDADALLAAATVAVLSSEEEGLGTSLLDAMAFGRPIAATRAGGIPEIVEHERSGLLVPVHDPESLGAAISRLVRDPALAADLVKGAHSRVREFSVERTTDLTLDLYRRVLTEATAHHVTGRGESTGRR